MKFPGLVSTALGALIVAGSLGGTQTVAKADTASTLAIAAGAAAIAGALLYDGNNRPYYVRNNHRFYVTQNEAQYYRGHHRGVERNAYVPEREYPVARDPYQGGGARQGDHSQNNGHWGDHRDDGHQH